MEKQNYLTNRNFSSKKKLLPQFVLLLLVTLLKVGNLNGQATNPSISSLTYAFTAHTGTSFPASLSVGLASSSGLVTTDFASNAPNGSSTGQWQAESTNGISYQGSSANPSGCFKVRMNTTGISGVSVAWTARRIINNSFASSYMELQWRNGNSGAWNNVANDQFDSDNASTSFSIVLPAGADNLADLQIRWIIYDQSYLLGSRDRVAVDDITICALPVISASDNGPICVGSTLQLTATGSSGTFQWAGPSSYSSTLQNPSRTNATTAMAGTYTVTVTSNGCTASATTSVAVNTAPTASAGANTPLCVGATLNLSTTAITGASYSWTGPNGFTSTSRTPSITNANTSHTGLYTVTVSNTGCNDAVSSVSVTVNPVPNVSASSNTPVCTGTTLQLNATGTAGTYAWSGPSSFSSTLQNPTRANATTAMAGTYTVTVTSNGCTASATTSVAVNTAPTASAGANTPLCVGATLNLSTTAITGASYSWTGPNGFTSTSRTPSITNTNTSHTGLYTVTVSNTGCNDAVSSISVDVNPYPVVSASSNTPACSGSNINLSALPGGGTYVWSGPASFSSTAQNPVRSNALLTHAGTYTVTVTSGGCSASASTTVVVNQGAEGNPSATPSSLCAGSNVNLKANLFVPLTYTANPNVSIPDNNATGVNSTIVIPAQVIAGASNLKFSININHTYAGDLIAKVTAPCGVTTVFDRLGVPASTNGNSQNFAGVYEFDVNASSVLPETNTGTTNIATGTYLPSNTNGSANSTWSGLTFPCSAGGNWVLNLSDRASGDVGTLVSWSVIILSNSGITYSWTSSPAGFTSSQENPVATPLANTTYSVEASYAGCTTTKSVSVATTPSPNPVASSNAPVCNGNAISFSASNVASGQSSGNTFAWRNPANAIFSSQQNPNINNATQAQNGIYSVTITNQFLCTATTTVLVEVNPNPTVSVATQQNVNCFGESNGALQILASNGSAPYDYTSDFVNFNQDGEFTYLTAGYYDIYVSDANGCLASTSATITEPPLLSISSTPHTNINCYGNNNGAITINATGGTGALHYSINNGNTFQNGNHFTSLAPSSYGIVVNDANGCIAQGNTITITEPAQLVISSVPSTNINCFGSNNGAITINASGGTGTLLYSINNGSSFQNGNSFTNLTPSTYAIVVHDANGCSAQANAVTISQPSQVVISSVPSNNINCFGNNNGSITIHAAGGTGSLLYSINNGTSFQNSNDFQNLSAGNYQILVHDANGCSAQANAVSITEPALLQFTPTFTDQFCPNSFGSISLVPSGGVSPYSYSFDNGTTFQPGNTANNVVQGIYTVLVKDANNCLTTPVQQAIILVNTPSTQPAAIVSANGLELCNGSSTTLSIVGGSLGSNATWKWYGTSCGTEFIASGSTALVSPPSSKTYYVRAEDACGFTNCANLGIQIKTGLPASAVAVPMAGMPTSACDGSIATLTIPTVNNASQYIWDAPTGSYFNGDPANVSPFATNSPSVQITFGTPNGSFYNVGVQAANACGSTLRKIQKVRGIVSVPASVTGLTTVCENTNNLIYTTPAVEGAVQYQWTITGDATVSGNGTSVNIDFGPNWNGGTLCVAAQTSCYTSATKCITIGKSAAALSNLNGNFTACPNTNQVYSINASAGAATYTWTLPTGVTGTSNTNSINATFGSGYNAAGNICVSVTSICGVASVPKCKTVAPGIPTVPTSITGISTGLCNQSVVFSCPSQTGATYTWTAPTGTGFSAQGNNSIDMQFGTFSTGQVCVTATNNCGSSAPRCVTVKGAPNAPASLTAFPGSWCANTSGIEFSANTSNITGSYTLSWTYPSAPTAQYIIGGGNSSSLLLDWGTGNGNIILTASNACGSGSKLFSAMVSCREEELSVNSANVHVYPNPSSGIINIDYANVKFTENNQLTIADVSGRILVREKLNTEVGMHSKQLNLQNLAKGIYMLEISGNKSRIVLE